MSTTPVPSGLLLQHPRFDSPNLTFESSPLTAEFDSRNLNHNSSPLASDQQNCLRTSRSHLYQGHRPESFVLRDGDEDLMVEWRARQRTFDVGLIYALLSLVLLLFIHVRRRRLNCDLSDKYVNQTLEGAQKPRQKRWGREFRTAGDVIIILSLIVLAIQIALIVIIVRI
ncbi:uncharacterized protein MELLADRAFT_110466 [Melampsora larici-populina 98AG31]|uniref:Uncharacterized protein n=1 Tax=Melampsora larici-populina (strain 98AG31 / pathotype 3-4-7) TaxID=747676 RepID=F4RZW5_MELLP|nr:uncharacterized protein MELLADRAFT_110466 [Melampsora larici-populina 98AG31]EGG02115.1 hypothetical protein MELLADRAFT_110466 [Melampsora larici-populina 98AG31]